MINTSDLQLSVLSSAGGVPPEEEYEVRTYVMIANSAIVMGSGTTLTLDPGVVMKFNTGSSLQVSGTLTALGTAAEPVVFTSYKDDAYGGDTNANGSADSPSPGDWTYILLTGPDGVSVLDHVLIRYGGASTAALYTSNTNLTLSNSEISFSATRGMYSTTASNTLTNNEVFGNRTDGYYFTGTSTQTLSGGRVYANLSHGITTLSASGGTFNGVEIFANAGAGFRSTSNQAVDATGNWWGAVDGASGDEGGSGDEVTNTGTGTIDASGFLVLGTASGYLNAGPTPVEAQGTIAAPTVVAGTDTTEFGSAAITRALFDLDAVELAYPTLNPTSRYDLFLTYINTDNTAGAGGNRQRLLAGSPAVEVHPALTLPLSSPEVFGFVIPPSAYAGGALDLRFERVSGYRAVVSQVVLVESPPVGDVGAPVTTL